MNYFDSEREAVFAALEEAESIVIFGHKNPDGDCVGSVMGMKHALKTLFPQKKIFAVGTHPTYLPRFIEPSDIVDDETIQNSLALMVDLSDLDRVEDQRIRTAKSIVCIDHHVKQYEQPFPVLRDENAASCTAIITRCLILRYGKIPSKESALYLYMGLMTDSGRFQYDSRPETLETAIELIKTGIDTNALYSELYRQNSRDLRYRSVIYSNFKMDGKVCYVCITKDMYEPLGLSDNEASGKVNLLSLLDDHPMWAAFTEQSNGTIRCELRSNGHYNVQQVAVCFNGGGHVPAAGCRLTTFDDVQKVVDRMNEEKEF